MYSQYSVINSEKNWNSLIFQLILIRNRFRSLISILCIDWMGLLLGRHPNTTARFVISFSFLSIPTLYYTILRGRKLLYVQCVLHMYNSISFDRGPSLLALHRPRIWIGGWNYMDMLNHFIFLHHERSHRRLRGP